MMTTNGEASNRHNAAPGQAQAVSGCRLVTEWEIIGRARLDGDDRSNVDGLRRACEAAERLDLKLELDEADHLDRPIHFLAVAGNDVIGYAGLTPGDEAEACGMVHPSWRRRGVGTTLLANLRAAALDLSRESILVICEDAAPAALAWMRRLGATLESAERRMIVRLATATDVPATADVPLELRRATEADHDTVAALLGEEFTDYPEEERLVGLDVDVVIGTLRLTESSHRTMIYGFVIDEQRRGKRLGTRMLAAVMARLREEGVIEVGLEVDPENTPAVRLYERFGFRTVTTYRYMRLCVPTNLS
jgi:ribosomal protein S18 acetylase RimI-like enzyme